MAHTATFRLIALLLVAVLVALVAVPTRTEAVDPTTILAAAGLAAAGVVLIAYLVVANSEGDKRADGGRVAWMACAGEDGCTPLPAETAAALTAAGVLPADAAPGTALRTGALPGGDRQGP